MADVVVTPELLSEPEDVDAYVVEVDGGPLVDVD